MAPSPQVLTRDEVAKHNTDEDCWIIMNNKVYDVSKFLDEHPGGGEVIKEMAGKDCTVAFQDVGHSKDAVQMAEEYEIGVLDIEDQIQAQNPATPPVVVTAPGNSLKDIILSPTWTNFLIPSAIGIAIYTVYKIALRSMA